MKKVLVASVFLVILLTFSTSQAKAGERITITITIQQNSRQYDYWQNRPHRVIREDCNKWDYRSNNDCDYQPPADWNYDNGCDRPRPRPVYNRPAVYREPDYEQDYYSAQPACDDNEYYNQSYERPNYNGGYRRGGYRETDYGFQADFASRDGYGRGGHRRYDNRGYNNYGGGWRRHRNGGTFGNYGDYPRRRFQGSDYSRGEGRYSNRGSGRNQYYSYQYQEQYQGYNWRNRSNGYRNRGYNNFRSRNYGNQYRYRVNSNHGNRSFGHRSNYSRPPRFSGSYQYQYQYQSQSRMPSNHYRFH